MPGIQEIVNKNRGVTVYNPVRPIRPRGRVANAGTAGRVLSGGGTANDDNPQQRTDSFIGGGAAPPAGPTYQSPLGATGGVIPQGYAPGALLARIGAAAPPVQEEDGGGFLGTLVNSGPGRAVMGALQVLDTPRRIVISGIQEGVDALNGGDASMQDFMQQVEDPTFGFGDIIGDTGNKWVNRFIGFTGDVLLDPLTYVAGAGLISGVGRGSRVSASAAARAAGTLTDNVTASIGRRGISILDDAERAALREAGVNGVMDAGYYFRTPFVGADSALRNIRIPGTGALERGVSGAASSVRMSLAGTRGATALRRWRAPAGLEDAWNRILTGQGPMPFNEAAALVTFSDAERMARGTFIGRLNNESARLIREASPGFRSRGGNAELSALIHKAETEGGTLVNDIFDAAMKMMKEVGINRPGRKTYVPHMMTDGASSWLRGDSVEAKYIRDTFFPGESLDDISPAMMERKLVPGNMPDKPFIINGKEFYIREGTIKEMNDQFARLVPDAKFKFYEDDFSSIIARYTHSMADDIGLVAGVRRLLNSKSNLVRRLGNETEDVTENVINDILSRHADPEMAKKLSDQLASQRAAVQTLRERTQNGVSDLQGALGVHAAQALNDMNVLEESTRTELTNLLQTEVELSGQLGRTPDGDTLDTPSPFLEALEREQAKLDRRLEKLDEQALQAATEAADARGAVAAREAAGLAGLDLQGAVQAKMRRYSDLQRERARLIEATETLNALADQVEMQRRLAAMAENAAQNPSLINLSLGERPPKYPGDVDEALLRPGQIPTQRKFRKLEETEGTIRDYYAKLRQKELAGADTRVQELEVAVEMQGKAVDRVRRGFEQTMEATAEPLGKAELRRDRELIIEDLMRHEIDVELRGAPSLMPWRKQLQEELRVHRSPDGALGQADASLRELVQPLKSGRQRVEYEQRRLDDLVAERARAVQLSAEARDPIYSTGVQARLLKIDRQEAADLARLRSGNNVNSYESWVEPVKPNWGRTRKWVEDEYDGDWTYMDQRDRADLIAAHQEVRTNPRATDADRAQVTEARKRIKAIEERYADELTPRQRARRSQAQQVLDDAERKLSEIRDLRRPMELPAKGSAARQAIESSMPKGGDTTIMGRAGRAAEVAFEELQDLPLAGTPDELARAVLDHPLVAQGAVPGFLVHDLVKLRDELLKVSDAYAEVPLPEMRGRMEQLTRDTLRYTDVMGRYRLAIDAGLEPSDSLAAVIVHRVLMDEGEALGDAIRNTVAKLENPRELRRQQQFEMAAESLRGDINDLRADLKVATARKAEFDAKIEAEGLTHANVRGRREAENRRRSAKRAVRKAENDLTKLRPPRQTVIGDDVDTITYMLEDQLRELYKASNVLEETKTNANRMFRPPRERLNYLEAQVPGIEKRSETMRIRADRQEAAIAKAEATGKNQVGFWDYEPTAQGREYVRMSLEEAQATAAQNRQLQSAAESHLRNARAEIDVIRGKARTRIEQIDRMILDQNTPPDIDKLRSEISKLERKSKPTGADQERLDFMRERVMILERDEPLNMQELGALQAHKQRLEAADLRYQSQIENDEIYARSVFDDGQQFFEDLVRGNREVTVKDMEILRSLFGGEGGEFIGNWASELNERILSRDVLSQDELRQALDDLSIAFDNPQVGDMLFERVLAIDPEGELNAVTVLGGDVRTMMIESAKARRIQQTRELTGMLKLLGIALGPTDSYGNMLLKMMGQKPGAKGVDRGALRKFVIEQLQRTGWDPANSYKLRLQDLGLAKNKVDRMRRALGSVVQVQRVKDPEGFYRWLYNLDKVTKRESAGEFVDDLTKFQALLLPDDMNSLYQNRLAALQSDLTNAITEGNGTAVDELTSRINQLQDGARGQGMDIPELPPVRPSELTPPERGLAMGIPDDVRNEMATQRAALADQLTEVDAQLARAQQATPIEAVDDPMVQELQQQANKIRQFYTTVDENNLSVAESQQLDALMDAMFEVQARAKAGGIDVQQALKGGAPATPPADGQVVNGLLDQRQGLQDQLDELDRQINESGAAGGDVEDLPEPMTDGLTAPDQVGPYDRTGEIADEDLTIAEIDTEFESVLSEYDTFQRSASIMRPMAGAGPVAETGEALVARARKLRALRKQKMSEMEPVRTDLYLTHLKNAQPATPTVTASWSQILHSGYPNVNTVRQLTTAETAATKILGGVTPTGVGRPLRDSLLSREKSLAIIEQERERLRDIATRGRQGARAAADEAKQQRRVIRDTEARVAEMEGSLPDVEIAKIQERLQQRQDAITNKRRQAILDREKAESAYTAKMNEIDGQLATTRQIMEAAREDADRLIGARTRIEEALSAPVPDDAQGLEVMVNDLHDLFEGLDDLPPEVASNVSAMMVAAYDDARRLDNATLSEEFIEDKLNDFARQSEAIASTAERLITDHMRPIAPDLVSGADSLYIAETMATHIKNLRTALNNHSTWKLIGGYTSFFKTYATMRPGFHVRNMMSGIFMNLVDNVQVRHQWRAMREYRKFRANPARYWETTTPEMRDAFTAVWGSGAGGQFGEYGLGGGATVMSKGHHKLMNNFATRANRKAGEFVEGTLRLGMAIDSLERGQSLESTLARITNYHFDYTQVSAMDRKAKQLIPFWTFMSRNLPLQIENMWLRPRTYLQYQSFTRNFAEEADPLTPDYWLAQGAFTMNEDAEGTESPWYLAPDLPHLRVAEPLQRIAEGDIGQAALSDINPLLLAPFEAAVTGADVFTGRPIEGYESPTGPMSALLPLLALLGGTATGGTSGDTLIDERYAHVARSILPPLDQLERYLDTSGSRAGRQDETIMRAFGAPVYQLTPELRESTRRRRYFEEREQQQRETELERL